jgi:mono/diheme cytochrome c family protein
MKALRTAVRGPLVAAGFLIVPLCAPTDAVAGTARGLFRRIEKIMLTEAQGRLMILALLVAVPSTLAALDTEKPDMGKDGRAEYNWVMHCQGCHGADAQGTPGGAPRMAGNVARFLQIKAGRAYLGRVPGVAFVELSDAEVAELLSWVVRRFDGEHLPKRFTRYSEDEIRALRREPLVSNARRERQRLVRSLSRRRQLLSAE